MASNLGKVVLVNDINPGIDNDYYGSFPNSSYPNNLTEFNGKLYFTADDGETGRELWVSDGTTQGTSLVVDLYPDRLNGEDSDYPNSSFPASFYEFNHKLYFSARDSRNNPELWVTDGTKQGTNLVAEIGSNLGYNPEGVTPFYGSSPDNFYEFNHKLYFSADDRINGKELWVTDGTTEGTSLVADICPGKDEPPKYNRDGKKPCSSFPKDLTTAGNKLYFTADDGQTGRELWVSDGTTEGTNLVADLDRKSDRDSSPSNLTEFNDKLYFTANNGQKGRELWVTDGTTEGTNLVVDLNLKGDRPLAPDNLTVLNDKLYFSADDGKTGRELWVSDGTTEGTSLVVDLYPSQDYFYSFKNTNPDNLIAWNNRLYFTAIDPENRWEQSIPWELWSTNGTKQGTRRVSSFAIDNSNHNLTSTFDFDLVEFVEFDNKLYFSSRNGKTGKELWMSDGTTKGTQPIADFSFENNRDFYFDYHTYKNDDFAVVGNELFFTANNGEAGTELYKLVVDDRETNFTKAMNLKSGDSYIIDRAMKLNTSTEKIAPNISIAIANKANMNLLSLSESRQYLNAIAFLLLSVIIFISLKNYRQLFKK